MGTIVWTLEYGQLFAVAIEFKYDATVAGHGVFGEMRSPAQQEEGLLPIGEAANLLRQAVASRVPLWHNHVRGHSGDLANELCDQLAKRARRHVEDVYERMLPAWPSQWFAHPLRAWTWLAHASSPFVPFLPALEAEASRLQSTAQAVLPPTSGLRSLQFAGREVEYHLSLFSYNVQTLFDADAPAGRCKRLPQQGLLIAGKRDVIKRQLIAKGIWAAGLQETRLPSSEVLPDADFLMLSAAATAAGHYGCALWLSYHVPYAREGDKKHFLRKEHVTVTAKSPRHLLVQITAPRLNLTLLVAHGPSSPREPTPEPQVFWEGRARELASRTEGSHVIVLADANAHLGSLPTEAVGPLDPEPENCAGEAFHSFLLGQDLFLPSTFAASHTGSSSTWFGPGPDSVGHRLDYVAIPKTWTGLAAASTVWVEFEALQARQDHLPVRLEILFGKTMPAASFTTVSRKAPRPALAAIDDKGPQRRDFLWALQSMPRVSWLAEIDQHCQEVSQPLTQAAERICVPAPAKPRQPYLQADTLAIVQSRVAIRKYLAAEQVELRRRYKLLGFAAFVLHYRQEEFFRDGQGGSLCLVPGHRLQCRPCPGRSEMVDACCQSSSQAGPNWLPPTVGSEHFQSRLAQSAAPLCHGAQGIPQGQVSQTYFLSSFASREAGGWFSRPGHASSGQPMD